MSRERGWNKDRTLLGVANDLYLTFGMEISSIGGNEGIAKVMVKSRQEGDEVRHESGKSLSQENDAGGRCLRRGMPAEKLHFCGVGIDLDNVIAPGGYFFLQADRSIDHTFDNRFLCGIVAGDATARKLPFARPSLCQ